MADRKILILTKPHVFFGFAVSCTRGMHESLGIRHLDLVRNQSMCKIAEKILKGGIVVKRRSLTMFENQLISILITESVFCVRKGYKYLDVQRRDNMYLEAQYNLTMSTSYNMRLHLNPKLIFQFIPFKISF